jgi:general secretion pathway protein L
MTASATTPSFLGQIGHRTSTLWHWWVGELSSAVPSRLRTWFSANTAVVDVAIDVDHSSEANIPSLVLIKPDSAELRELKRVAVDLHEPTRLRAQVDELLKGYGRDARLIISPAMVLRKRWSLPLATEENLQAVIGFDMDRQTPFVASQVYYGARVTHRDPVREKIDVEVAAVPRTAIDGWLNDLRAAGLSIQSMVAADDLGKIYAPIELMPANAKPERRWSMVQRLNLVLFLGALALALAAVVLPIWQKRQSVIELMPVAAKANSEFAVTQKISSEYSKLAGEYNFILGKKHGTFPITQIFEDLTKAFPDNTWLKSFELKTQPKVKSVEITGDAPSVVKIIETLEQTSMFQNMTQKTQTTRGAGNLEQFNLLAELKARPLPEALTLEAETAAATVAQNVGVPGAATGAVPTATPGSTSTPATARVTVPVVTPPSATPPTTGLPGAPLKPTLVPVPAAAATPPVAPGIPPSAQRPPPVPGSALGGDPLAPPMPLPTTPQGMGFTGPVPIMPTPGAPNLPTPANNVPPPMPLPGPSRAKNP